MNGARPRVCTPGPGCRSRCFTPSGSCWFRSQIVISISKSSSTPTRRCCGTSRAAPTRRTRWPNITYSGWHSRARCRVSATGSLYRGARGKRLRRAHDAASRPGPDQPDDPGVADLGYRLLRRYWRQGLATEAARALLQHAFLTVGVRRVIAQTMAVNAASRGVMTAVGMSYVRTYFPGVGGTPPRRRPGRGRVRADAGRLAALGGAALVRDEGRVRDRHLLGE